MKIEKLNENKIRITLNLEDLKEKNIDFHSFMSNPIESQTLFLDMLDTAEKEVGFITKDYKLTIEALALSNGNFVLTVTRDEEEQNYKQKVRIKRKSIDFTKTIAIYAFTFFEEVYAFCKFMEKTPLHNQISLTQTISLYEYKGKYFLCFKNVHGSLEKLKGFCSSVTEFGTYIDNSDLFERKLIEYGTKIIDSNAIDVVLEKFN